jgi:hypothetical protein
MMPTLGLRLMDSPHMLNLMSAIFATSPAFFEANTDEDWTKTTVHDVFPYFDLNRQMVWAAYFGFALLASSITETKFLLSSRTTLPEQAFSIFRDPSKM